jgi:hypothetical protein
VAGHVARHLDVLHLVLAHRDDVRAVDEDVRRHQHRVGEQADARGEAAGELVLVRVGPLQQAHAGHGGQDPRQLGHLRHVRLAEEDRLVRVEAEGQVIQGHVADVVA